MMMDSNLQELCTRLKRGAYRAKPVRRVYIPKADGRQRPLGVTALEDKVVQRSVVKVLNAIYESDFLGFSYGFRPGRQRKYSNHAIETAVTLGMVFHLSSRQSEGLLRSLFALMKLDNDVPDHTTISRRKAKLGKVPFYQDKQKTPLHILIDSSSLAVHAGQLRRAPKSRDYRKLHLCVDEQTGEVVAGELTSKRARDSSRVASLVGQIDSPISSARADTAYDASGVYEAIENHSAHRSPRASCAKTQPF